MKAGKRKQPPVRRVGVVTRTTSAQALTLSRQLDRALKQRGLEVLHDIESAAVRRLVGGVPRSQMCSQVDLVITLGGDGTLLSVARHPAPGVPILGIDIGTLGFLTSCAPSEYEPLLDLALRGEAPMERRRLLSVTITRPGQPSRRSSATAATSPRHSHSSRFALP